MTPFLATLIARARQGDARAIAQLITRSLADQGIVARGYWQGTDLHLDLESDNALGQSQVVPPIRRGLLRLGLTCPVHTVWVTARRVGCPNADWCESFALEGGLSSPAVSPTEDIAAAPPPGPAPATPDDGLPPSDRLDPLPGAAWVPQAQPNQPALDRPGLAPEGDRSLGPIPSDTTLIALAHLAPVLSYLVLGSQWLGGWPLFWGGSFLLPWRVVAPLVLLLVKGAGASAASNLAYVQQQAKAALNFQLTMFVAWVITIALMFVLVGFLLVVPLTLFEIVSCIVAAVRASEGKPVHYGAIRFVR
ncbi:DUF4870 domain-containing protein [Nodosilinea nodulosa]|uniref:DUF4870 domain-containing protein n=1 Tax=Nodosilinea nodulosa TaxID=416001 RepID=UPI0002F0D767|nr:DUF4870 domain-containing protein [Nodosilinea nodulosa]